MAKKFSEVDIDLHGIFIDERFAFMAEHDRLRSEEYDQACEAWEAYLKEKHV